MKRRENFDITKKKLRIIERDWKNFHAVRRKFSTLDEHFLGIFDTLNGKLSFESDAKILFGLSFFIFSVQRMKKNLKFKGKNKI